MVIYVKRTIAVIAFTFATASEAQVTNEVAASRVFSNDRVVLEKNRFSLTFGLSYSVDTAGDSIQSIDIRSIAPSLELKYGISSRAEIYLRVPFFFTRTSVSSIFEDPNTIQESGSDGFAIGGRYTVSDEGRGPELSFGTEVKFRESDLDYIDFDFSLVKSLDPIILSLSTSIQKGLSSSAPDLAGLNMSMAFIVNESVALKGGVDWQVDISNSIENASDFATVSLGSLIVMDKIAIEPQVNFGITDAANDATIGILVSRDF